MGLKKASTVPAWQNSGLLKDNKMTYDELNSFDADDWSFDDIFSIIDQEEYKR